MKEMVKEIKGKIKELEEIKGEYWDLKKIEEGLRVQISSIKIEKSFEDEGKTLKEKIYGNSPLKEKLKEKELELKNNSSLILKNKYKENELEDSLKYALQYYYTVKIHEYFKENKKISKGFRRPLDKKVGDYLSNIELSNIVQSVEKNNNDELQLIIKPFSNNYQIYFCLYFLDGDNKISSDILLQLIDNSKENYLSNEKLLERDLALLDKLEQIKEERKELIEKVKEFKSKYGQSFREFFSLNDRFNF